MTEYQRKVLYDAAYLAHMSKRRPRRCTVDGCNRYLKSHDLCASHLARYLKYGSVQAHIPLRVYRTKKIRAAEAEVKKLERIKEAMQRENNEKLPKGEHNGKTPT